MHSPAQQLNRAPRRRERLDWSGLWFVAPIIVLVTTLVVLPVGRTFYYSLTSYAGLGTPKYVGTKEFRMLLHDSTFHRVITNNLILALGLVVWIGTPFLLAVLIHQRRRADLLRTLLFIPVLLPPVVVGLAFRVVLGDQGPINSALGAVGLGSFAPHWLTDQRIVLFSIILVITWAVMGTGILFYSAGLAAIPRERVEAAVVDGAEWRHLVWNIYRPALRRVTRFLALVLTVSTVTGFFPWIFSLTHGGPGISSTTIDYDVYQAGILSGDYGTASAIAVVSIIFLCLLVGLMFGAAALIAGLSERRRAGGGSLRVARATHTLSYAAYRGWSPIPPRARRRLAVGLRTAIIIAAVLAVFLPLAWDIRMAVKPEDEWLLNQSSVGGGWTLENFGLAWKYGHLGPDILNSIRIVPLGALIATVSSTLAGFALAKLRTPGRRIVLVALTLAIFVPLPAIVIPIFNQALSLGYANNQVALSVIYGALLSSWGALFMYATFRDLPEELLDSARVDGASVLQMFLKIALPLAKPAVVAVLVLNLLALWNELILALVLLPDPAKQTLTVSIATFSTQYVKGGPVAAAAALIAMFPIVVIYAVGQRFIRADIFAGAVKG
jgi:ABC-type sugar transport system permease subunit